MQPTQIHCRNKSNPRHPGKGIKNENNKKDDPLKGYKTFFPTNKDLRQTAFKDFGLIMALTMSALEAVFFGFALPLIQNISSFNYCGSALFFVGGVVIYFLIIIWRGPKPFAKS